MCYGALWRGIVTLGSGHSGYVTTDRTAMEERMSWGVMMSRGAAMSTNIGDSREHFNLIVIVLIILSFTRSQHYFVQVL